MSGMAKSFLGAPRPPVREVLPLIHANLQVEQWLAYYWEKLSLPVGQMRFLALTMNRQEFAEWTGRRLQSMALGCYCYLPLAENVGMASNSNAALGRIEVAEEERAAAPSSLSLQPTLPGFGADPDDHADVGHSQAPFGDYRHLIFIEPGMLDRGIEVTVAHELIHLSDRVKGQPRKHHYHGNDSISVDEAAITGRDAETLRRELAEETRRREETLRRERPYKYFYYCPRCKRNYPRVRRYARPVSCGHCFRHYNPEFLLRLRLSPDGPDVEPAFTAPASARDAGDSITA